MSIGNNRGTEGRQLPVAKGEDVEFSAEQADQDDLEAQARADAADERAEND